MGISPGGSYETQWEYIQSMLDHSRWFQILRYLSHFLSGIGSFQMFVSYLFCVVIVF